MTNDDERDFSEEAHNRTTLITGDGTYERGGPCPDCGSTATTIYPMDDEGAATLYCDTCKREEPQNPTTAEAVEAVRQLIMGENEAALAGTAYLDPPQIAALEVLIRVASGHNG